MQPEVDVSVLFSLFLLANLLLSQNFLPCPSQKTYIIFIIRMLQHPFFIISVLHKPPTNQRIVPKGLHNCNNWLLVVSQQFHYFVTCLLENSMDSAGLHGLDKHSGQSERHFFRELFSHFSHVKTVSEINMNNLACITLNHDIVWMSVSKPNDVSHNGHNSQRAYKARSGSEPFLAVGGSGP